MSDKAPRFKAKFSLDELQPLAVDAQGYQRYYDRTLVSVELHAETREQAVALLFDHVKVLADS